jgi:hypothetical protein
VTAAKGLTTMLLGERKNRANLQIHVKPQNKKVGKFLEGTRRVQQIKPVSEEFLRTG